MSGISHIDSTSIGSFVGSHLETDDSLASAKLFFSPVLLLPFSLLKITMTTVIE